MNFILTVLLIVLTCGCGRVTDLEVLPQGGTSGSNTWTDLRGVYTAERIKMGYRVNHKAFFDEIELRPGAVVQILQDADQSITVRYETVYGKTLTNRLEVGSTSTSWRWLNGDLVYSNQRTGNNLGYMMPGRVTQRRDCLVRKNPDGTVTVSSSHRGSGRALWLKAWSDPEDVSMIQLVPQTMPNKTSESIAVKRGKLSM